MIISRTPFRVSFFGGGTDYPIWFREHEGAVLATTINKHCYISCRHLPPFFGYKSRIIYSKMECVDGIDDIQHPAVREAFRFMNIKEGIELHHDADLPARAGLGTSSTFTVGLLNVLYAYRGNMPSKMQLALDAIKVEQELIPENVGCQDQTLAAFGGFNRIDFRAGENPIRVTPIILPNHRYNELQDHLMLLFTGFSRNATDIAAEQIKMTPHKKAELSTMYQMVSEATNILNGNGSLREFGKLLHESWLLKRGLTNKISNPRIDEIYEIARSAGALGGKVVGAGGGGFMLLMAPPENQPAIIAKLNDVLHVPFRFSSTGSEIIFYDRDAVSKNPIKPKELVV
ncbi:MAG: D-glycero-alpha-D-manno-heptose 7-phosphate kinase [Elusimicrobia bacterium]|nr:D-glycero-alpha-D-manno-heptose 7-phosphate kinase [Elusimicrobiota bacterium]